MLFGSVQIIRRTDNPIFGHHVGGARFYNFARNISTNMSTLRQRTYLKELENCLFYLSPIISKFLYFIHWMVFDFIFYCVTMNTLHKGWIGVKFEGKLRDNFHNSVAKSDKETLGHKWLQILFDYLDPVADLRQGPGDPDPPLYWKKKRNCTRNKSRQGQEKNYRPPFYPPASTGRNPDMETHQHCGVCSVSGNTLGCPCVGPR